MMHPLNKQNKSLKLKKHCNQVFKIFMINKLKIQYKYNFKAFSLQ
jgi:hypothetical protein